MLCDPCQAIDFDQLHYAWNPSGYSHHKTFAELAECKACPFCTAVCESVKDGPQMSGGESNEWRGQQVYLRLIPSSDGIGREEDVSNLLVFTSATANGEQSTYLVMYGLFIDRTKAEWETGEL